MPKIILRCNYLKNAPASHLSNFIKYIGTREGVEKISTPTANLPATVRQKELIQDILHKIKDVAKLHEYYDYIRKPTRENASEFITQALEYNLDIVAKKKNYMDYLANRPGAERIGSHGLFSNEGEPVVLSKVQEEVANHKGVVWTNVVSLRREDAERLGYDSAVQWQELVRSRVQLLAENYKIDSSNLKWYAAFHNESHHPHIHLVVYSTNPSEGFLTKTGIETMRFALAHDIFRQDFMSIYERKTEQRDFLKEQAETSLLFLMEQIRNGVCHNETIAEKMQLLSKRLQNTTGKKVYGYLKADVKAIVNQIVDELAKETLVSECYQKWQECRNEVLQIYKDTMPEPIPLSEQKDLKRIKNMVIRHAVHFGQGIFYIDDETHQEMEEQRESHYFAQQLRSEEVWSENPEVMTDTEIMENGELEFDTPDSESQDQAFHNAAPVSMTYYVKWTDSYKQARRYLYGTEHTKPDLATAYKMMKEEAENGNALALYDIGRMHQKGIFVETDEEGAQEWYRQSLKAFLCTEEEKPKAYLEYRIGKMHQYACGTKQDFAKAAGWFQQAAFQGNKYAMYSLGMLYYRGEGVKQSYENAFRLFQQSHENENAYASYELAKMYEKDIGTEKQTEKSDSCYRIAFSGFLKMAKKSRDDNLMYRIGCMYLKGKGTEVDEHKAEGCFLRSSEYGNAYARYQLAKLYIKQELAKEKLREEQPDGFGQTNLQPDTAKIDQAVKWLTEAAEKENYFAAYALGRLYADGILIENDMEQAIHYLTMAAEHGNDYAAYRLGKVYSSADYFDLSKAVYYLTESADHENEFAAYRLGKMYLSGVWAPWEVMQEQQGMNRGKASNSRRKSQTQKQEQTMLLEKNTEQAIYYLSKSAGAGNQFAQYALGKLYLIGKDVEQDKEKAFDYFTRSAAQGNIYAQYFIDHWNDLPQPDLCLMATRLMHQLGQVFADQAAGKSGGRGMTESKLRRRIREKKIALGHARDDHESVQNQQQQHL